MSKHETSNQFKDGLMMDVHPLQTPNTVLTDCVNGTFITYNGNEHVLQNDMGNFKLSKCKLKENYIPIGTASYGDILYIASYNPIDKRFELGSYPSPLQWNALSDSANRTIYSIIDDYSSENDNETRLSWLKMSSNTQTETFDDPKYKLQPGDEYQLEISGEPTYAMEKINYYVLDENMVKHNIDVKKGERAFVSWETPGYLCIENSVMTPFEHSLSLRSASVGNNLVIYSLQSIITVQDENLCKLLDEDDILNQFVFELSSNVLSGEVIKIHKDPNNSNVKTVDESDNKAELKQQLEFKFESITVHPWLNEKRQIVANYTITLLYTGDNELVKINDNNKDYKAVQTTLTVLPTFVDNGKIILYDNLQQSLTYNAAGDNVSSAASKYFTWHQATNDDESHYWVIEFDTFIANDDDEIEYEVYDIDGTKVNYDVNVDENSKIKLDSKYDNQLVCIKIKITGQIPRTIGRFAFLDTSGVIEHTPYVRMDVVNDISDVLKNVCNEYRESIQVKKEYITATAASFNYDVFNVQPNKHTVWLDNVFDAPDLTASIKKYYRVTLTDSVFNLKGLWTGLRFNKVLSDDKKVEKDSVYEIVTVTKGCVTAQQLGGPKAYIPCTINRFFENGKSSAKKFKISWDQIDTYDCNMVWYSLDDNYSESKIASAKYDSSDKPTGTNRKLWNEWLRTPDAVVCNIGVYKTINGGNNYSVTGLGYMKNKGWNGAEKISLVGYANGTTIPELIMTNYRHDWILFGTLVRLDILPENKLKFWKNRYLYEIKANEQPHKVSYNDVYIKVTPNPSSKGLLWLFDNDPNKLAAKWEDVEFDPNSKMEWITNSSDYEIINKGIENDSNDSNDFTFDFGSWNTVVAKITAEFKDEDKNIIFEKMTNMVNSYKYIPVNCLHFAHRDAGSDLFPLCLTYDSTSHKWIFNKELARALKADFSSTNTYFQSINSGDVRANLGPLKIIKYGF